MSEEKPEPLRPVTVLIVDDDEQNRLLLETIIREATPYKPILAASGAEALAHAHEQTPDLVLLDVLMPAMDGYEVADRFKGDDALQEVPIIFITALSEIEDKVEAFERGGIDYIVKPIEPREVISRVTAHMNVRLQNEEIRRLNREMNLDLDLARQIQEAIMPGESLRHPKAIITGRSLPMEKVSGDYFDTIRLDDDVFLVFLADIMGHGVPAALYTMMLKTDLHYLTRFSRSPAVLLERLNQRLCKVLFEDYYITASMMVVDLSGSPEIVFASAGHPPPIRIKSGEPDVSTVAQNDIFLGWKDEQEFMEVRLPVSGGETFFIYTDGFAEAVRKTRGTESPAELIKTARDEPDFQPEEWLEKMMEEFEEAGIPAAVKDDVTVISVVLAEPSAQHSV